MNILIAGFPYIRESFRDTFKKYPKEDQVFFLLPNLWPVKNGAIVFNAPNEPNIISTQAFFHHSNYPIIGGLLKGWMPAFPLALYRLHRKNSIDLIYSCSEPILLTTLYQALFSKLLGFKHIFFSWENIPYEQKFSGLNLFIKQTILRLNILLSDGIICGNKKGREILDHYTKKPIEVIPMSGLDSDLFRRVPLVKEFQGQDLSGKIVFTFVGAIGYRKGLTYLLKAFSKLHLKISNTFLVIAGSGEYENELTKLINSDNISDCTLRVPWVDHVQLRALLGVSDVFVYPSISHAGWQEQFGYSMAEASLMELPIITTSSGSILDVVIPEKTGLVVKEKDSEALCEAMRKLSLSENLRADLGKNGRQFILEHYSNDVVVQQFYKFFHSVTKS